MTIERRQSDIDLALVRRDVQWIRETLQEADLPNRVATLEKGQARLQGMVAALTGGIVLVGSLISAAKAIGLL